MASAETNLLTRIVYCPEEMLDLERLGFDTTLLSKPYAAAFDEITRHLQVHKEGPSAPHLLNKFPGIEILKQKPARRATVYWEDIVWVRWHASIVGGIQKLAGMFPSKESPDDRSLDLRNITQSGIELFTAIQSKFTYDHGRPRLLSEVMKDVEDEYLLEEAGKRIAIEIPFAFLQEELRGYKSGQLYVIAGRPKTGKSWYALISAAHAIMHKWKVLFVSLEMRQIEMARRLACIIGKISYNRVMKKTLNPEEREKYLSLLHGIQSGAIGKNIQLVGPGVAKTPEAVDTLARSFGADMVVVDAFYVMESRNENAEYWEKVLDLVRRYRRLSLASPAAWMLVTQFNRSGGKGRASARLDMLAFSDAIGQDANAMIYVVRPMRLKKAGQVDLVLGEAREADDVMAFRHFWNFRDMRWDVIGAVEYGQDDDEV